MFSFVSRSLRSRTLALSQSRSFSSSLKSKKTVISMEQQSSQKSEEVQQSSQIQQKNDLSNVLEIMSGFRKSQTLFVATKLNIFDLLDKNESMSSIELSKSSNCDQESLEKLLDSCVSLDLLLKNNENRYSIKESLKPILVSSKPQSIAGYIKHSSDVLYPLWNHLSTSVQSGQTAWKNAFGWEQDQIFQNLYKTDQDLNRFIDAMGSFSSLSAPSIVSAFDLGTYRSLVDIGGANGNLVVSALERYPELTGTVFELPSVAKIARNRIQNLSENVSARMSVVEGDFFNDKLPPQTDLFVLSRILHDWQEEKILVLLKKLFESLDAGGSLLVCETLLNESKTGPIGATLQSLNMLVQTKGKERNFNEYKRLMENVGFERIEFKLTGTQLDCIIGHKPSRGSDFLKSIEKQFGDNNNNNQPFQFIRYKYIEKGGTGASSAALGVNEHAIIKTLVFQERKSNDCFVVLQHGDAQCDTKRLQMAVGAKNAVTAASPDIAEKWTGYRVGGVSPFGLLNAPQTKIYAESSIFDDDEIKKIWINAGARGFLVSMTPKTLQSIVKPTLVQVAKAKF